MYVTIHATFKPYNEIEKAAKGGHFLKNKKISGKVPKNHEFAHNLMDNCWTAYDRLYVQSHEHYFKSTINYSITNREEDQ